MAMGSTILFQLNRKSNLILINSQDIRQNLPTFEILRQDDAPVYGWAQDERTVFMDSSERTC